MLTSKERIIEVLDSTKAGGICDDCLSEQARVSPRQQVNSICRGIEKAGKLKRHKASCQVCKKEKTLNSLMSILPRVIPNMISEPKVLSYYVQDPGAELDSKRRHILQIFNQIEKSRPLSDQRRESFSERLSRLNDAGKIPAKVVAIMRFLNNMRNIIVYENCKLEQPEINLIEAAWGIVLDWHGKFEN